MRLLSVLSLGFLLLFPIPSSAAELIMYRQAACPWCAAWDRAIGPIYGKTENGRRAPLRQIDIAQQKQSGIALASRVIYTPTFVLADEGREIGRIEGYPGEDFFWGRLNGLMEKLPSR